MKRPSLRRIAFVASLLLVCAAAAAQQAGSIRGIVYDEDFDAPLPLAQVMIAETGEKVTATEDGSFVFAQVPPGKYTLVFSKDGYARQVKTNIVVVAGQLTDVDATLSGEFTEMDEFIVQDLQIGGATEAGLLRLRLEDPAFLDSISAELMSQAGASDAASALRLVAGASVQEGKFAVVRGLPDRYVNSQMNGVRLPTADEDKRAVQLDQFPAAAIESIRVSKTFTPDQQGDASGGAVNVVLKGIPDENIFQIKSQISYNTQVTNRSDFLTYDGGGLDYWGRDADQRSPQLDRLNESWEGAVGVSRDDAPTDYKWSIEAGGKHVFDNGVKIGGFASAFYERDSSFFDNGVDNSYWVTTPGGPLEPQTIQGTVLDGDFKTQLFDVTQATESVQWGVLGTFGVETDDHSLRATYLYTRIAEDTATLAEDTRGKEFFFPNYDPNDPTHPGNQPTNQLAAPYLRTETLEYTERTTETVQFHGKHRLPIDDFGIDNFWTFKAPEIDWTVSRSLADLDQPDKRQFGTFWLAESINPGFPPFVPPSVNPPVHLQFKPAVDFTLGNLQRIFKTIDEESEQFASNVKLPFEQWSDSEGYLKVGVFYDQVKREFDQDTYSNFNDSGAAFQGDFDEFWSAQFPLEDHPISDGPPFVDVDYRGDQEIAAFYAMMDLPLSTWFNVIGGARFESTEIGIVNFPEANAMWFPPEAPSGIALQSGDADVDFDQNDVLPSIGFVFKPFEPLTFRASYSETVARQTFKELTPIIQQEFLGGPIFIGNPALQMSSLQNYDLRVDYSPYEGSLLSASWFYKDVRDPIENVQRIGGGAGFTYTTPVNFPKGRLYGVELEARQNLGQFTDVLRGLAVGANATIINSEVTLSDEESAMFLDSQIMTAIESRPMTNAPEDLYNLFLTYELEQTGTQFGLFYTIQGDTLIAGATESDNNFIPDVYQREFDTLNLTITQKFGKYLKLQFQAKNLTNPTMRTVYRSDFTGADVTKTSFTKGIDYSIALGGEIKF